MKMNTPNPLVPQGTFSDGPGRSRTRIVVFTILAAHVVFVCVLLLQGCKRTTSEPGGDLGTLPPPPDAFTPPQTNIFTPPPVDTNIVVTPPTNEVTLPTPPPTPPTPPSPPTGMEKEHT